MKKTLFNAILVNVIVLSVYLFCGAFQFAIDLVNSKLIISSFAFIFLSILLILYFGINVSYSKQKICLIIIASLMLLFMVFRVLKYGAFSQIEVVSRHLWYLYYFPILFIAFFLLVTSLTNYYETHKRAVFISTAITGIISLLLTLLIATNDFHQLAFKFKDNFLNWDSDYSHGVIYYITLGYVGVLLIASFVIFFRQCRIAKGKRCSYVSLIPLALGLLYVILYILDLTPQYNGYSILCEFPETICFMVAGYILSLINLRIIALNRNYKNIFLNMSLPAFISNKQNEVAYQNVDGGLILSSSDEQKKSKDYLYQDTLIPGGKITWINDISDLNAVYQELSDINERLKEEEQLNHLISNLEEEQLAVLEKNKLYDEIARGVVEETSNIMQLSKEIKAKPALFNKNMPIILLQSIYIKRYANLKLLSKEKGEIELKELYLSLNESLRYLEKMGVKTALVGETKGTYDSDKVFNAYTYIAKTILNNLNSIEGVTVLFNDKCLVKVNIEGKNLAIDNNDIASINEEDGIYYITVNKEAKHA